MEEQTFPGVSDRVKAVIADTVVLILLMVATAYLFSIFENVPDIVRIIAFLLIFVFYDPIMTSSFGGTIGHMLLGIRVKRTTDFSRNIPFPWAIVRFIFKASLGWISLLTVSSSTQRRAIHDLAVGSTVLYMPE
ncbi:MAG TPA: RDD family protein [Williamwhitmania sp.]|nr:RDD family protein [Williamwhitmania sp.]